MVEFGITERTKPKLYINIGACLDIPTSNITRGAKGEYIINGGLGNIIGIVGAGNNYKSTIEHFMGLSAANKIKESHDTRMTTYDTEVNISLDRLEHFARQFDNLPENIITGEKPLWSITDKSIMSAEDWSSLIFKYCESKAKDKNSIAVTECFIDPYTKKPLEIHIPTFIEIDSFTDFESSATGDLITKDIDSSDTNTFAMKQGLFKLKFLTQLPRLSYMSNTVFFLTAQVGEKINMATGPAMYSQPTKKLQYLKAGDNIKGVSSKFTFLTTTAWFAHTASVLKNQTTKQPEYPYDNSAETTEAELNTVKLTMLRNKNGQSGNTIEIVISQTGGVLPTLTEFHNIKENGKYGISGSNLSYVMDVLPEVSLSRTTVRKKIDTIPKLRRAINITSELMQLHIFHAAVLDGVLCSPKELYDDIKALGYDWDILLNTRGYWTINQYSNKKPFLSTVDLLYIRSGGYFPYFLNEDKTLKELYKEAL
jgi:hypothetical protein